MASAIANGIDFLSDIFTGKSSKMGGDEGGLKASIKSLYALGLFMWLFTFGVFSEENDFSAVMTAGTLLQCLGFLMLIMRVHAKKSVEGLSSQTFMMFALFLCCRLTSTTMKDGYIPLDTTGDFMMQTYEFGCLLAVCHLLYCIHKMYPYSYQEEEDTLPILPLVVPCVIMGYFVHGDFNKNEFFDFIWATSLNLETLSLVPQLWMMAKTGGQVNIATSHFIACTIGALVCRFTFWVWAYDEQTQDISGYHILTCHVLQLVLCADYLFYCVQSWLNGTLVELPGVEETEM
jgi:ER lumen protein retaining receptor